MLAHGIARFDVLLELLRTKANLPETQLGDRFQYFKGIKTHLEAHGFTVFTAEHLNQVGWWDPREAINPLSGFGTIFKKAASYEGKARDLYLEIARNLN